MNNKSKLEVLIPIQSKNLTKAMKYNEISHFSHPQHNLRFEYAEVPFKCDGCKEIGIGSSYKCKTCEYDLHMHCAIPTPCIYHPFYPQCSFTFMSRPPGSLPRYCNACERGVTGFLYHCKSCGFDLHPCCAQLPMVLDAGEVNMFLYRKVSGACQRCGKKGRSWSYRSSNKKSNLHVACVKDMLIENWHDLYYYGQKHYNITPTSKTNSTSSRTSASASGVTRISNVPAGLKGPHFQTHPHMNIHKSSCNNKGKVQKYSEMAGMGLQFVISALLGDPTSLIASLIGSLMSR